MKHLIKLFIFLCLWQTNAIGQMYTWSDTTVITSTPTTFTPTVRWEFIMCWSDSVEWMSRVGASSTGIDTTSWDSRDPLRWAPGEKMFIGPGLKMRKLEVWTVTGTGVLYRWGYKRSAQY